MRFCLEPGCTARQDAARCPKHSAHHERGQRGSARERGYDARWDRAAKAFLRKHPLCGDRWFGLTSVMSLCKDEGRITAAVLVDHVEPHRGDAARFWDERNWQSLCRACHDAKTRAGL